MFFFFVEFHILDATKFIGEILSNFTSFVAITITLFNSFIKCHVVYLLTLSMKFVPQTFV